MIAPGPRSVAIAAPHHASVEVAARVVRAGGNAIDAALAAAASLTVTYPNNVALGGDLIALVHRADGSTVVINASGPTAAATDVGRMCARGDTMPERGALTVTVPGLAAGLKAIWEEGASLTWAELFAGAIKQASHGIEVVPSLAAAMRADARLLTADPGLRDVFTRDGEPLVAGDLLRQPALAHTLRDLADQGPDVLYAGDLANSVVSTLRAYGSLLDVNDFAAYRVERSAPLRLPVGAREILTAGPNSQGFLLLLIMGAAADVDAQLDPLGDAAGALAVSCQHALDARDRYLGDPAFAQVPLDELLSAVALRGLAADAVAGRLKEPWSRASPAGRGDTVAVVTADSEGNAVSLIQSLFYPFGAGILDPGTGIICHNRGACFSLEPGSPNVLEPLKRPAHTLTPCLVLDGGRPAAAVGTMGGSGQPQLLAHVLLHVLGGRAAPEAVASPRWVVGGMGTQSPRNVILLESGVPAATERSLRKTGLPVTRLPADDDSGGHAQLVTIGLGAPLEAASDPRSEGAGIIEDVPRIRPQGRDS